MFEHKWFRFALGSLGLLAWLALFAVARFGHRDVRRFRAPVKAAAIALLLPWIGFWVTDHEHLAHVFQLNFWGLFCAFSWLTHRYRVAGISAAITTLNLSDNSAPDYGHSSSAT